MFRQIAINLIRDKKRILEFHCRINYESDTDWARNMAYQHYSEKWLATSQPEEFYSYLQETMKDERTLAEIWVDEHDSVVGYLWVIFNDIKDYSLTIAEIMDILVTPEFQGRGVGSQMLKYIEEKATELGADLLRSETGIENIPSQKLHEKRGFGTYRVLYEKKLK